MRDQRLVRGQALGDGLAHGIMWHFFIFARLVEHERVGQRRDPDAAAGNGSSRAGRGRLGLSRLCLFAPPSAIVAILPFIYNLLKQHPTTTFMIHRHPYPPYTKFKHNLGNDPFDPNEPNPQLTNAIDSSLWELETCQSHYHPTVASIARIISEQFTKRQYNLEDFLDHGYATLLESEFKKKEKKPPVVEYKIPKKIFSSGDSEESEDEAVAGQQQVDQMLDMWDFE